MKWWLWIGNWSPLKSDDTACGGRGDLWWRSTYTSNVTQKVIWEKLMTSVKSESPGGDRNVTEEEQQTARDVQCSIDWRFYLPHTHFLSNLQSHIKSHPKCFGETEVMAPNFVVTTISSLYDEYILRVVWTTDSVQCLVKTQALTPHCVLMPGRNYLLLQWDRFSRPMKSLRAFQPLYKYRPSFVFSATGKHIHQCCRLRSLNWWTVNSDSIFLGSLSL